MALLTAFLIAYFATPFAMKAALRAGAIDMPGKAGTDSARHLHKKPTPRMGGLAIYMGFVCSALLFAPLGPKNISMLAGATIIVLLGVFDDIYDLPAMKKLVVQLVAAAVAVLGGNKIYFFSRLMSLGGHWDLGILSVPVTLFWIVLITNAVNLIDGLDGLAAGVSTISCVSLVIIALVYSNPGVAIITSALAGGCIGFLPYNRPPAKIFMGDTGSTLLGYVMAVASIQGLFKFYAIISFVIPFLMLGVPIFDTCFAVIRRLYHGESPFKADREHVHYRLMDMGFSKKQTVAVRRQRLEPWADLVGGAEPGRYRHLEGRRAASRLRCGAARADRGGRGSADPRGTGRRRGTGGGRPLRWVLQRPIRRTRARMMSHSSSSDSRNR